MTFACRVTETINKTIAKRKLSFERADIEVKTREEKRGDIILWEKRKIKPALLIEIESPEIELLDVFEGIKEKARLCRIPYFAIWNIREFRLWKTPYPNEKRNFYESVYSKTILNRLVTFEDIMDTDDENMINDFIIKFVTEFATYYYSPKT